MYVLLCLNVPFSLWFCLWSPRLCEVRNAFSPGFNISKETYCTQPLLPSCEGVLANLSDLLLSLLCGLPGKSYLFLCFTCHLYLKMITHKSLLPAKILHLSFRPNHLTAYQIFPLVLLIKCIQNQILRLAPKPTLTSPYSSAQWMASLATLLAKSETGIQPRNLSSYLPHMKSHPFCVSL